MKNKISLVMSVVSLGALVLCAIADLAIWIFVFNGIALGFNLGLFAGRNS